MLFDTPTTPRVVSSNHPRSIIGPRPADLEHDHPATTITAQDSLTFIHRDSNLHTSLQSHSNNNKKQTHQILQSSSIDTMAPRQRSLSTRQEDSYESTESLLAQNNNAKSTTRKAPSPPPPPTLNQTEADIARDQHDFFNLVALVGSTITNGFVVVSSLSSFEEMNE